MSAKSVPGTVRNRRAMHRKQKRQQKMAIGALILILIIVVYVAIAIIFSNFIFMPDTKINGVDCGLKTVGQAEKLIEEKASQYVLSIVERNDEIESMTGESVGLKLNMGSSISDFMKKQSGLLWVLHLTGDTEHDVEVGVSYDDARLSQAINALSCMDESKWIPSEDVSLTEYDAETGFSLKPEVYGTTIKNSVIHTALIDAIKGLATTLDLSEAGCYVDPVYTTESEEAKKMLDQANEYCASHITYEFGDTKEVVDGNVIVQWLDIGDDFSVTFNEDKAAEYVKDLASRYDTKWKSKTLTTRSGRTITVPGGNYGWRVNQEETLAQLLDCVKSGKDYTGEVEFHQRAASFGDQDFGHTYIEASISAQHLWFYKDGALVTECDFVSGDPTKSHDTPKGAYSLAYKARNQTLEGQGYSSPVSYWMPFVEGCGLHDASWRSTFGGSIYQGHGSHGCLNLPSWAAAKIYENIEAGTAILVY